MGLTKPRAAQIYNLDYKQSTRVVTVTNITLSAGAPSTVDGVSLSINDRVLVTAQSTASQNGIYKVSTVGSGSNGTWARTSDANETGEIEAGMIVMVTEGTIYADTQWKLITDDPITVGTTALTFTQNYSANSISGGTSNVTVLTNANVTISSAGTANVLLVSSTGTIVTGTNSVTGNITAGNVLTGGLVSATGNITGNYFLGNVFYANGITASKIYSGTSEVNVTASGGNVNVSIGGTSNVAVFTTAGEYVTGLLSVSGNTTAGNILTGGLISATGNVTGNYFLGNVACASGIFSTKIFSGTTEANIVSANGNLAISVGGTSNVAVFATTGEYVTGLLSATGNIISGNLLTGGVVSATANITGGNILTGGVVSATGNVTGNYLKGNASQVTGVNTFSQIFVTGATTVNAASLTSNVTFTGGANIALTSDGNIITIAYSAAGSGSIFSTGGDMGLIANPVTSSEDLGNVTTVAATSYDLGTLFTTVTYNQIDMTGFTSNINTGNLNATGLVSAAGNITGLYIKGNGSQLTSLPGGTSLTNGTSNIVVGSSANITLAVAGTSNVVVWANTGQYVTGIISATGNIVTGANGFIGIGTATPDAELNILATPQTVSYSISGNSTTSGTDLHISGADGANTRITQDAFGTGSYSAFTGRSGRGTAATPTQTLSGDTITQFTGRGFSNGSLQFGNASTGRLDVVAAENFTDTSRATNVQIFTTAVSSITPAAVATFSGNSATIAGNLLPSANATYDLGSTTARWKTVYTTDLELNNGIGDYTVVEGADDLFLYNNRTGKVFKFALIEVDPSIAPPKAKR